MSQRSRFPSDVMTKAPLRVPTRTRTPLMPCSSLCVDSVRGQGILSFDAMEVKGRRAAADKLVTRISPSHGWHDVAVGAKTRARLRELATLTKKRGSGAKPARGRGITALFSGPSGTGKT